MGRPLFRLAGQDPRKRPAGTLLPRFPHLPRTPPNPPARVHAACVLAPGPPDLAGHRIGPARRAMRLADRRPAPVRFRRLGQTARRIPERRPDVGSGQRRQRAARRAPRASSTPPPSTPMKVQTGAGRARWRASRSSAIRSVGRAAGQATTVRAPEPGAGSGSGGCGQPGLDSPCTRRRPAHHPVARSRPAACHWPTDVTSASGMGTITRGPTCRGNGHRKPRVFRFAHSCLPDFFA